MSRKTHSLLPIFLPIFIVLFSAIAGLVVINGTLSILVGDRVGFGTEMMLLLPVIGLLGGAGLGLVLRILDPLFHRWRIIALAGVWAFGLWGGNLLVPPLVSLILAVLLMRTYRQKQAVLVCLLFVFAVTFFASLAPILMSNNPTYETTLTLPGQTEAGQILAFTVSPLVGLVTGAICGIILILMLGIDAILDPGAEERRKRERELYAPLATPPRKLNSQGVAISDDGELIQMDQALSEPIDQTFSDTE